MYERNFLLRKFPKNFGIAPRWNKKTSLKSFFSIFSPFVLIIIIFFFFFSEAKLIYFKDISGLFNGFPSNIVICKNLRNDFFAVNCKTIFVRKSAKIYFARTIVNLTLRRISRKDLREKTLDITRIFFVCINDSLRNIEGKQFLGIYIKIFIHIFGKGK